MEDVSIKDESNNNKNNSKSNDLIPNFEILSEGTLRRYQAYFNLRTENGGIAKPKEELINLIKEHFNNKLEVDNGIAKPKEELINLIKEHFNNKLEVDNEKVIENFMRIEKDQTNEKNNSLRKSIRFQEKSIAKFLDNFNVKS